MEIHDKLNRLGKWRTLFAGWQLGTRSDADPEAAAVRDHREATLMQRAELSAITRLLIDKGVFTQDDFVAQLGEEADALNEMLEKRFPGVRSTGTGLRFDKRTLPWMKGWKP